MRVTIDISRDSYFSEKIRQIGLMIPDRSCVIAPNEFMVRDFGRVIGKRLYGVHDYHMLAGLENFTVIKLGRYYERKDWPQIEIMLRTRRGTLIIDLPDWR